jgi:hypothetical protein
VRLVRFTPESGHCIDHSITASALACRVSDTLRPSANIVIGFVDGALRLLKLWGGKISLRFGKRG